MRGSTFNSINTFRTNRLQQPGAQVRGSPFEKDTRAPFSPATIHAQVRAKKDNFGPIENAVLPKSERQIAVKNQAKNANQKEKMVRIEKVIYPKSERQIAVKNQSKNLPQTEKKGEVHHLSKYFIFGEVLLLQKDKLRRKACLKKPRNNPCKEKTIISVKADSHHSSTIQAIKKSW